MYEVNIEERLVSVKFGSRVTIHDIARYAESLREDSRFDPTLSEIIDLTSVEEIQIEAKEAMALADRVDPFLLSAKRAFVAQTPAQVHAARMHQLLRGEQKNIGIFSSVADAKSWIANGTATHSQVTPRVTSMKAGSWK